MELKFFVDTQLPPSLAEFFRRRNFNATHVIDYPSGVLTNDKEIIKIAKLENRIVVTKDSDFFDNYILNGYPPSVFLLQLGNIKNSELFSIIDNRLDKIKSIFEKYEKSLIILKRNEIILY